MIKALNSFLFGNLRGRLIIGVATVQTVMMVLFISDLTMQQRTMLLSHQEEHAIALSQTLATSAAGWLAAEDIAGLQELVEAQRSYPGLIFAMLTDNRGHVLADTDRARRGMYLLDLPKETKRFVLFKTANRVDVATPALIGGRQVGWARVGIGPKTLGEKLAAISRNGLFYTLAAILAGSVIAWLLGSLVTRRLYAIQETLNRVRAGDHHARAKLTGSDEAAVMAQEFNAMLDAMAERDTQLQDANMQLQKELQERKLTDEALQREKTLLRCIIDSASDLIFIKDLNSAYLRCNKASEELIGLPESAQIGKTDFDFFDRKKAEQIRSNDLDVLSSRKPIRIEEWLDFPNGRRIFLDTQKVPFYGADGEIKGLVGVSRDITERKRAEVDLRTLNEELELRVKERTAELEHKNEELEKLNKIFIGRELRMVELKKRIAELETVTGDQGQQNAIQG